MVSRTEKFRGKRTHGRGHKAGRGAGKRGGRGNAGLHKHKYNYTVKYAPSHFGMHGFKRPQSVVSANVVVNVAWLKENASHEDFAQESGTPTFDLTKMGIDKLLGGGNIDTPVKVIVEECSAKAKEKVEAAGGEIINPQNIEEES